LFKTGLWPSLPSKKNLATLFRAWVAYVVHFEKIPSAFKNVLANAGVVVNSEVVGL
jgi:hypothetical protein